MFATIAAGGASTCGIESGGSAYCWGYNDTGALGSGDTARAIVVPVAVAGGLKFKSISAARCTRAALPRATGCTAGANPMMEPWELVVLPEIIERRNAPIATDRSRRSASATSIPARSISMAR